MATINYYLRTTKRNPTKVNVRFINGKAIDMVVPLNVLVNPKNWDKSNQKIKNVIEVPSRDAINRTLGLLKINIMDRFNMDYSQGEIIDRAWLNKVIREEFNRPKHEKKNIIQDYNVYYTDFASWWIKEKADDWQISAGKYMTIRAQKKHTAFIKMIKTYEGKNKLKIKDITNKEINKFAEHLSKDSYASATVKRHVTRFKFFMNRAEQEGITVDPSFKQRIFVKEDEKIKEPYFNPNEIEKLYNHDFSDNERLENVRDNLIIAVWTGLRVSDFLNRLDLSNFIDDFIEIRTQKTGTPVVIPVHPQVKKILIKRNGKLPKKISDVKFNLYVKEVCELAGFTKIMRGKLHSGEKNRDVAGDYPKFKLVSSHIGRRSFATNHYGKIADSVIMAIGGWKNKETMLNYIQTSNREHAVELKKYWEEIYEA